MSAPVRPAHNPVRPDHLHTAIEPALFFRRDMWAAWGWGAWTGFAAGVFLAWVAWRLFA